MLIAFEGIDGAGKSTQAQMLFRWLKRHGPTVLTSWNSSKLIAPAIKKAKKQRAFTPTSYALFHAADFADRHERIILPALINGETVVCDRYRYTAEARDVVRGCDPEWVAGLYDFATQPDIVFWIDANPAMAATRKGGKPKYYEAARDIYPHCDAYEAFDVFQSHVRSRYEEIFRDRNCFQIDAALPVKEQQRQIRKIVDYRRDILDDRAA